MVMLSKEELEDLPKNTKRSDGFEFVNSIKGGVIPQEYIAPCEKGFREGLDRGVLAGFKIVNVSVDLWDGSYHEVDSNEMAFKIAASMAIQDACRRADPVILGTDDESGSHYSGKIHGDSPAIFLRSVD